MNRTIMSPVSAVSLMADWMTTHARAPLRAECRRANGLPHYQTLQYVCGGLTEVVRIATAYLTVGSAAFSSLEVSGLSACPCSVRMTTCLRCEARIVWEGPHVRQCATCRRQPVDAPDGAVRGVGMRRTRMWEDGDDLVDWSGP